MTMLPSTFKTLHTISLVLFVGFVSVLFWLVATLLWSKPHRETCSDFDTYAQALRAFAHGNQFLDGNKNGIPCEKLKRN